MEAGGSEKAPGGVGPSKGYVAQFVKSSDQVVKPTTPRKFTISDISAVPSNDCISKIMRCCCRCKGIPAPGSYVCSKGHLTCFECLRKQPTLSCAFQSDDFGEPCAKSVSFTPCHLYQKLFDAATVPCPTNDCEVAMKGKDIASHEAHCRGVEKLKCWVRGCPAEKMFSMKSIIPHLLDDHRIQLYRKHSGGKLTHVFEGYAVTAAGASHVPFVWENDKGDRFVCVLDKEVIDGDPVIIVALYHDAGVTDGGDRKLYATIEFLGELGDDSRSWSGRLPKIGITLEKVLMGNMSLNIPDFNYAASSGSGFLRFTIHVRGESVENLRAQKSKSDEDL